MAKSRVNLPFSRPPGATGRCAGLSDGLRGHQSQVAPDGDMERPLVGPLRNLQCEAPKIPIGSMYAIYGNMDPINIPPLC